MAPSPEGQATQRTVDRILPSGRKEDELYEAWGVSTAGHPKPLPATMSHTETHLLLERRIRQTQKPGPLKSGCDRKRSEQTRRMENSGS